MSKDPRVVKEELIQIYPKKLRQKRSEQIVVTEHREDGSVPEIKANVRSSPGIITQRGCTYAGCKGVVIGPSRDILSITHGPIGCSFYAWLTRRNQTRPASLGRPELHHLLPVHGHAGREHRLRRREEAEGGGQEAYRTLSTRRRSRSSRPARSG